MIIFFFAASKAHTHKHDPTESRQPTHTHPISRPPVCSRARPLSYAPYPPPSPPPPPPTHAPRHQHNKSAPHPWPSAYMLSPFPHPTAPLSDRVTPQLCSLPSAPPSPSALLLTSCERPLGHLLATQWGQSQF